MTLSSIDALAGPVQAALAEATARAVSAIAAEVPADVAVAPVVGGIRLTGASLSLRALTDARLRDFAAIARVTP